MWAHRNPKSSLIVRHLAVISNFTCWCELMWALDRVCNCMCLVESRKRLLWPWLAERVPPASLGRPAVAGSECSRVCHTKEAPGRCHASRRHRSCPCSLPSLHDRRYPIPIPPGTAPFSTALIRHSAVCLIMLRWLCLLEAMVHSSLSVS